MWSNFIYFALAAILLWNGGAIVAQPRARGRALPSLLIGAGLAIFALYIALLWVDLGRAPMKSMGETRLWYSLLLSGVGLVIYLRWSIRPILLFSTILASVFVFINLLRPEIHEQELMPALQSVWFVPHVILYMMGYGVMSYATLAVIYTYIKPSKLDPYRDLINRLIYCGVGLLIVGMLTGALWAKEAWGNYWSWDIKECWALITAMIYLLYLHDRRQRWAIVVGFIALQVCWYGVNFLPAAARSIHTY